jgi:hypothetical protein
MQNEQEASKEYYVVQWANDKDLLDYLTRHGWYNPSEVQKLYEKIHDLKTELSIKEIDEQV